MSPSIDESLLKQKKYVIDEMVSYMKYGGAEDETDENYDPDFDAGYTQEHIDECDAILSEFLASVQAHSGAEASLLINDVKTAVLALNTLNEKYDCSIIETDQREEICTLIDEALKQAGFAAPEGITDEWREW